MKWNVEEANPKTGQYRTLTVDAPDRDAAEALGRFMGVSVSEVAETNSREGGRVFPPHTISRDISRGRLTAPRIVLLSVLATLMCTIAAVWLITSFRSPASATVDAMPDNVAVGNTDVDRATADSAEDSKSTVELSEANPAKGAISQDVKDADEAAGQTEIAHEYP